jgi:small ligand-binding sensory domain FIST
VYSQQHVNMQTRTIHADSLRGFRQTFENLLRDDFKPTLAMVFASVDLDLNGIAAFLAGQKVQVFGCSSCGEFVFDTHQQIISEGALACLLFDIDPSTFSLNHFDGHGLNSFDLGVTIGKWTKERFSQPGLFILASGLDTDGEQIVRGIQEQAGEGITMFGGLAGDDAHFNETYVFSAGNADKKGAVALVMDLARYQIEGIATSGWVGIGADKLVTHAEGNIVYTIDDQPALEVYKEYLNVRDEELPEIGIEYPLMIKKRDREAVLRAVINVDREKKSLIFAGSVPNGSIVSFSSSPGFEIVEFTKQKVGEFHQNNPNADVLILFSCMARHSALGPTISEEMEEAWHKWSVPLAGFFTYGEIGNNYTASCDFYNQTFTLVAIKER